MIQIIEKYVEEFKGILSDFGEGEDLSLERAETVLTKQIYGLVTKYLGTLYEQKDEEIRQNKVQRKADGLVVERRGDSRQILTTFGTVTYARTYYRVANGYDYPVDRIVGVDEYSRISNGVSIELVSSACTTSYENSTQIVTGGAVSRQTVMRTIRQLATPTIPEITEKKKVSELHIDADEDHVALQSGGKGAIVPVVVVYEGKRQVSNGRNVCVNPFNCSKYGMDSDDFWEDILKQIEARYDISEAKIYLHADGGNWIQKALDWIPNVVFVLDDFHKNKAIKMALSGIKYKEAKQYEIAIRSSFLEEDATLLTEIRDSMIGANPDREKTICQGMNYLINFFNAIHLRAVDPENVPGGSSEPHVQHILSARLSSTPKGWSKETLKHFVPVLATRQISFETPKSELSSDPDVRESKPKAKRNTAGMVDPDLVTEFPVSAYKHSPLAEALKTLGQLPV